MALPERRCTGTPCHRQLSTSTVSRAQVSVPLAGSTPSSSTYDGSSRPSMLPAVYRPAAMFCSIGPITLVRARTWEISSGISPSAIDDGGSIISTPMTCSRWDWCMSRMAPVAS